MMIKGLTALAVAALIALVLTADSGFAQGVPAPMIFRGTVTVAGAPAPDGYNIYAQIEDYTSQSVQTKDGKYNVLTVAPPAPARLGARNPYAGEPVKFYLDGVLAAETIPFAPSGIPLPQDLNLTFPSLPLPTPTVTPISTNTPIPTNTPVPTNTPIPTNTPVPTNTPIPTPTATATPSVANPMTFSTGLIVAITGAVPENAQLTARIGDYTSAPATVAPDGKYYGLIVNPVDANLIGQEIKFFLNEIPSRTTRTFESGAVVPSFDLLFEVPMPTPVPPTATPEPTAPEPTKTALPPATATPPAPPPTAAPAAPPTPAPEPTATPVPEPTNTPEPPPTNTPMAAEAPPPPSAPEQSGGCASVTDSLPFGTAAANLALLLAPLGLLGIRKLTIRHRR